jgi:hypothetical protein
MAEAEAEAESKVVIEIYANMHYACDMVEQKKEGSGSWKSE